MRSKEEIIKSIADGEPFDFSTIHFSDPRVRENYRRFETIALNHIANRECIFCFGKANEDGLGMLNDLERVGYCHGMCIEAFYDEGFEFKLIGFVPQLNDYSWEIVTR